MQTDKKPTGKTGGVENKAVEKHAGENVAGAHDEAIHDIEQDPDFSMQSPNDDLDEGETARLGEDRTDIV